MESISTGYYDIDSATHHQSLRNRRLLQSGLNYYDNTARLHDPLLADFKSGDPKFTDYPSLNHYSHCGANFANLIDIKGESVFLFDKRGSIIQIFKEEEEPDELWINDGEEFHSLILPPGTIKEYSTRNEIQDCKTKDVILVDYIHTESFDAGVKIFEFMADNTIVEWGLVEGDKDNKFNSYISTSHATNGDVGGSWIANNKIESGTLSASLHNHPSGIAIPSEGDIRTKQFISKETKTKCDYYIYTNNGNEKKYTNY